MNKIIEIILDHRSVGKITKQHPFETIIQARLASASSMYDPSHPDNR